MKKGPTSFYGNLVVFSQGLARLGLDVDAIFAEAGVDLAELGSYEQRIPFETVDRVWQVAVKHSGNPCLGLDVVEGLNPAVYRSLGIALICSDSLRDFFQRFERFFAVISTLETTVFSEHRSSATFSDKAIVHYSDSTVGCHSDAFLAFTLKFIRMVYLPDYHPLKVQLAWTPPKEHQARYEAFFGSPVEFGCEESVIHIKLADLDKPLAGANPDLARHNDQLALTLLEKLQEMDLPTKVYTRLIEFLPSGRCSRERVAHSLNMSESAFQKKLRLAGTSYQELLDKTRSELAQHHLKDGVTVDEVGYLLGFSDTSNFIRAFKRWLGVTPRHFRNSVTEASS